MVGVERRVERMTFPGVVGERLSEEVTFEQDLNDEKKANRQTERSGDLQAGGSAKVLAWVPAFVYSRDRKRASVSRTKGAVDIRIKR